MTKKEKKCVFISIFVIILCFFVSIFSAFYMLVPKDKFDKKIKDYYINSALEYFSDFEDGIISLDHLIKEGYAIKQEEIKNNFCDYKTSFLIKDNNLITLQLNCNKYTKNYKIVIPKEY